MAKRLEVNLLSFILAGVDRHLYLAAAACGVPRPTSCRGAAGLCSPAGAGSAFVSGLQGYGLPPYLLLAWKFLAVSLSFTFICLWGVASRMQCTSYQIGPSRAVFLGTFCQHPMWQMMKVGNPARAVLEWDDYIITSAVEGERPAEARRPGTHFQPHSRLCCSAAAV